ncbi:hypothetical protein LCGC14_1692480 [marine sediment metagenome]|uniref:Uncharacterized protein n=1 Tax=marine sediment metagenome TaxID=412755 RepID=A0A0F9HKB3_9ZZZZ
MSDGKLDKFLWKVPFIHRKPTENKGDARKVWGEFFDDPPEGWRVPEDRKEFRAVCNEMFDQGYSHVLDFWVDEAGIHLHSRNVCVTPVPYLLNIGGREFEFSGRLIDMRYVTGHVIRWHVLKKLLELNEVEIDFDKIEYPEEGLEKLELETELVPSHSELIGRSKISKFKLLWTLRSAHVRGKFVLGMYKVMEAIGRVIAPNMYSSKEEKDSDNDQG